MASSPLVRNGQYDGARNQFMIDPDTVDQNAKRINMSPEQYKKMLNEFVESYSKNPLLAYEHTDLSHVPIRFDAYRSANDANIGVARQSEGSYNPETGQVTIKPNADPAAMLRTLLHELNHAAMSPAGSEPAPTHRYRSGPVSSDQVKQFTADPVTDKLSYGDQEIAAFITETMHPAARMAPTADPIANILQHWVARHPEVAASIRERSAQPTRPVTNHPKSEIEYSLLEKIIAAVRPGDVRDAEGTHVRARPLTRGNATSKLNSRN